MEILSAQFGFCIGIERAYRGMSRRGLSEGRFTVTHQNSASDFDTLRRIEKRDPVLLERYPGLDGLSVTHDIATVAPGERIVLGFHGLTDADKSTVAGRGAKLVEDLICPFIAKLDRVVERHVEAGYDIAIVGSPKNHHVLTAHAIAERHGRRCFTIAAADEIDSLPVSDERPIVLVGQVTGNTEVFRAAMARIEAAKLPIKVTKTMCSDSHKRQRDALELSRRADVVILFDDGGDAAQSVFEVCSQANRNVRRVRRKEDVEPQWLDGAETVAVVCGILVPEWSLAELVGHVRNLSAVAEARCA